MHLCTVEQFPFMYIRAQLNSTQIYTNSQKLAATCIHAQYSKYTMHKNWQQHASMYIRAVKQYNLSVLNQIFGFFVLDNVWFGRCSVWKVFGLEEKCCTVKSVYIDHLLNLIFLFTLDKLTGL